MSSLDPIKSSSIIPQQDPPTQTDLNVTHPTTETVIKILETHDLQSKATDIVGEFISTLKTPSSFLADYINPYVDDLARVFQPSQVDGAKTYKNHYALAGASLNTFQIGLSVTDIIFKGMLLEEAKKQLEKLELNINQSESDKLEIERLKEFIDLLKKKMLSQAPGLVLKTGITSLMFARSIYKIARGPISTLRDILAIPLQVLCVAADTLTVIDSKKKVETFEAWIKNFGESTEEVKNAKDLLLKRKERFIKENYADNYKKLDLDKLSTEERKIEINKIYEGLSVDEKNKYINRQTMSPTLKQALIDVTSKKAKVMSGHQQFEHVKNILTLSLSSLSAAIGITLSVIAIVGTITLSLSIAAIPGVGLFILGIAILALGIIYLYKKRPNVFKAFMQAIPLRQFFFGIVAKVRRYQLLNQETKLRRIERKIEKLVNPNWHKKQFNKLKAKTIKYHPEYETQDNVHKRELLVETQTKLISKLNRKREHLCQSVTRAEEKLNFWEGKEGILTHLNRQKSEAEELDFSRSLGFFDKENNPRSVSKILAKQVNKNNGRDDAELVTLLESHMGINIKDYDEESLEEAFFNFFKMDEEEMLGFIGEQMSKKKEEV